MAFLCPQCRVPGALEITSTMQLPQDNRFEDIMLQIIACTRCSFHGIAIYEELRGGRLDAEAFHHTGYRMAEEDYLAFVEAFHNCPQPYNPQCSCETHRKYTRHDIYGAWQGVNDIPTQESFTMRLVV